MDYSTNYSMDYTMDYNVIGNQENLKDRLRNENLFVTFTKKDGQERKMLCTLNQERIGTTASKTSAEPASRAVSTTSLAVYDLEKQAWRSFRWDSITGVETE